MYFTDDSVATAKQKPRVDQANGATASSRQFPFIGQQPLRYFQ